MPISTPVSRSKEYIEVIHNAVISPPTPRNGSAVPLQRAEQEIRHRSNEDPRFRDLSLYSPLAAPRVPRAGPAPPGAGPRALHFDPLPAPLVARQEHFRAICDPSAYAAGSTFADQPVNLIFVASLEGLPIQKQVYNPADTTGDMVLLRYRRNDLLFLQTYPFPGNFNGSLLLKREVPCCRVAAMAVCIWADHCKNGCPNALTFSNDFDSAQEYGYKQQVQVDKLFLILLAGVIVRGTFNHNDLPDFPSLRFTNQELYHKYQVAVGILLQHNDLSGDRSQDGVGTMTVDRVLGENTSRLVTEQRKKVRTSVFSCGGLINNEAFHDNMLEQDQDMMPIQWHSRCFFHNYKTLMLIAPGHLRARARGGFGVERTPYTLCPEDKAYLTDVEKQYMRNPNVFNSNPLDTFFLDIQG